MLKNAEAAATAVYAMQFIIPLERGLSLLLWFYHVSIRLYVTVNHVEDAQGEY